MLRRRLARHVPGLSRAVRIVESLEHTVKHYEAANAELQQKVRFLESVIHKGILAESSLVTRSDELGESGAGRLPVPPPELRYLVAGTTELDWFLRSGRASVETLVELLGKSGKALDQFQAILDQGCGCGRVIRHLDMLPAGRLHGCDVNGLAVRWCQNNLPHAVFETNGEAPPFPYPDRTFDLIYSWSIFTHFTEPQQVAWMEDLRRILVPGGYLVISLHGDAYLSMLTDEERKTYELGRLVVQRSDLPGSNICCAFHPAAYVRDVLARGFEIIDFIPQGAKGNPIQDVYLLELKN
jgi:SAM-dependent methyltransferase